MKHLKYCSSSYFLLTQFLIQGKGFPNQSPLRYFNQEKIEIKAQGSFIFLCVSRKIFSLQIHVVTTPLDRTRAIILAQSKGPSSSESRLSVIKSGFMRFQNFSEQSYADISHRYSHGLQELVPQARGDW